MGGEAEELAGLAREVGVERVAVVLEVAGELRPLVARLRLPENG